MATFMKKNEALKQCPYNKAHMMKPSSYQSHLAKCRKDHLGKDFTSCPFNAQHVVSSLELRTHLETCKDRTIVERQVLSSRDTEYRGAISVPSYANNVPESTDYWDEECSSIPGPGYDPKKRLENNDAIFRDTANWKPLDKREYYKSLQQRITSPPEHLLVSSPRSQQPPTSPTGIISNGIHPVHAEVKPKNLSRMGMSVVNSSNELNPLGRGSGVRTGRRLAAKFPVMEQNPIPLGRGRPTSSAAVILPPGVLDN